MAVTIRKIVALFFCCISTLAVANPTSIGPDTDALLALKKQAEPYASFGAVVLSRQNEIVVDENRLEAKRLYRAIYLTNDEAVSDYSKLVNSYNAYYHDSKIDFARVITADGQVYNMQNDAISVVASDSDNYLDDMKQVEFAVPQLKVGNIIEYQISEQQTKPIVDDEWFTSIGFRYIKFLPQRNWVRIDPVLTSTTHVTLPTSVPLYRENRNTDIKPVITKGSNTTTYTWGLTNLDGIKIEPAMPPIDDMQPVVYLSTMKDWKTIDSWYSALFAPSMAAADNVSALATELFDGLTSQTQKVKAVFEYMQKNVRYIGAHVNRGGYQPHTAQEVLQNAYGDCKDQATLIVALLRNAGIEAYPALVNTYNGSLLYDDLPALNFNHMITYVKTDAGNYWLDTSGQTGTFPGVSALLGGKQTFIIDGKQGEIVTIPDVQPKDNLANVSITYVLDGKSLGADVKMTFDGQVETNLRNFYQFSPDKRVVVDQLMSPLVHDNRVSTFSATDPADTTTPFVMTGHFDSLATIEDAFERFHYSMKYAQLLKVFTGFSSLQPVAERHQSLYVQIPITVNVTANYPAPWPDAKLAESQIAKNYQNPFFEITHSADADDDRVISKSTFIVYAQTIPVAQYQDLYDAIESFKKASDSLFIFDKQMTASTATVGDSLEDQIAYSRTLLDDAKFDEALGYIQNLAAQHQDNGELQYLLGIVYGFSGDDEASQSAFERAEKLGYQY